MLVNTCDKHKQVGAKKKVQQIVVPYLNQQIVD
jgi:hypothetical protein